MRIVFISENKLLHEQWKKAFYNEEIINIYTKKNLEETIFDSSDLVIFDYDNLSSSLNKVLNTKLICLSSKLDEREGFRLLKLGAKAYGNNYMAPMNLKEVIKIVKDNRVWVYPELMTFMIENTSLKEKKEDLKIENLSVRELDVAKLVAKGFSNKEIAQSLGITERTVKAHISSSFVKLEVKDRVQMGLYLKDHFNL